MNVKFAGVMTNIFAQLSQTVSKIELAWVKSGTDASPAAAVAAGRGVTWNAPADNSQISNYQSGGQTVDVGALTSGTAYTPNVRITKKYQDATTYVGPWTAGTPFTIWDAPAVPVLSSLVQATGNQLAATWAASNNAATYDVYIRAGSAPTSSVYDFKLNTANLSYTTSGLAASTTYYVAVSAVNPSYPSGSTLSDPLSCTTEAVSSTYGTTINGTSDISTQGVWDEESGGDTGTESKNLVTGNIHIDMYWYAESAVGELQLWINGNIVVAHSGNDGSSLDYPITAGTYDIRISWQTTDPEFETLDGMSFQLPV